MRTAAAVRSELAELVERYAPEARTGEQAAVDVEAFARIEKLAAAGRMLAAGRVAETKAWQRSGHRSPADWLAAKAGTSVGDAAGVLATSKQVRELPATARAVRAGELSPGQARAVADAAAADPGAEGSLLATAATETFKGLTDRSRRVKAAATDHAARDRLIHARRSLRSHIDAEGAFNLHLRGTALAGARITELLRPLEEQAFRRARTSGVRESFEARSFDAFMELVERLREVGLDAPGDSAGDGRAPSGSNEAGCSTGEPDPAGHGGGPPPTGEHHGGAVTEAGVGGGARPAATADRSGSSGGTEKDADVRGVDPPSGGRNGSGPGAGSSGARRTGRSRPRVPRGANTKVIVRIDRAALARGHTERGETCEIAGLGPVSVATVQELMADAFVAAVVTKGRDVVNVAHLGRTVNAHQRTAIEAGGVACTNIACNQTVGIEIDHREPWAEVGETLLSNQDPLCRTDHLRKTHHGWSLEPGTGRRRFLPPPDRARSRARPTGRGAEESDP